MSTPHWLLGASQASPELTPSGLARRDSMGAMLQAAVVSRRRRRRAVRWAGAAGLMAALALVALPQTEGESGALDRQVIDLQTVRNDPGLLARYTVPNAPISPETWIGDNELLELLDSAGRTTGLIRVERKVTLTADVTDEIEVEN